MVKRAGVSFKKKNIKMNIPKNITIRLLQAVFILLCSQSLFAQKVVRYELYVKDTLVNYAGKEKRAISVNGQIPMPTLTFTEGDTAEIVVHNQLKESTSLHWHGVFLPNKEDGVPWLTQKPIAPGTTYIPFSDYPAWHALVSFALRLAGADRHVRKFYHEEKKR